MVDIVSIVKELKEMFDSDPESWYILDDISTTEMQKFNEAVNRLLPPLTTTRGESFSASTSDGGGEYY